MDGQCDYDWMERIFNMPLPPTPPRRKVPAVAAHVASDGRVARDHKHTGARHDATDTTLIK